MPEAPILRDPLPSIFCTASLNLLAGASGIGKTALIAWLARQFRDGAPVFGHPTFAPPAIGYLTADRPWRGTKHWWEGVGFPEIRHCSLIDDASIPLPQQRNKHQRVGFFKECVGRLSLPPGSLLFVDPIALYLGGNLLDYDSVAFACIQIHRWLAEAEQQYCVIGLCHTAKQKADKTDRYLRLQDRILGSGALLGYTGTQMYLAAPEETGDKDGRYTFLWNPHQAKAELFYLCKDPNTGRFLYQGEREEIAPIETLDDFELLVLAQFAAEGALHSTFSLVSGVPNRRSLFSALGRLLAYGYLVKVKHGLYRRTEKALDPLHQGGESLASSL